MQAKSVAYVFIDAANLWEAQKAKGKLLDYQKLNQFLNNKFDNGIIRIFYYAAYPSQTTRKYNTEGKHKFFTYLQKSLGFSVRKKELKRIIVKDLKRERTIEKGNMDVEMTIDAVSFSTLFQIAIFFTGDSDFLPLVTYLKKLGKKVFIYSSKNNISRELLTGSDGYIDLLKIQDDIWRNKLDYRQQQNRPP